MKGYRFRKDLVFRFLVLSGGILTWGLTLWWRAGVITGTATIICGFIHNRFYGSHRASDAGMILALVWLLCFFLFFLAFGLYFTPLGIRLKDVLPT